MKAYGNVGRGTGSERAVEITLDPAERRAAFARAREIAAEAARRQQEARAALAEQEAARDAHLSSVEPEQPPEPIRAGVKPLPLAAVHTHSEHCAMWPPHKGRGPLAKPLDELLREHLRPIPEQRTETPSEPVEEPDTAAVIELPTCPLCGTPSAGDEPCARCRPALAPTHPVHALATSTAARSQHADARLDDHAIDQVEALVQRIQKYRPTGPEQPLTLPAAPGRIRCALCRRLVRHDPGKAAAALSEHYTTQHPGGH